jgi:hypothetical protein
LTNARNQFRLKETDMATAASKGSDKSSTQKSGSSTTSNGGHPDAVRELLVRATRVELATLTALSKFVVGWTQAADRYTQAVSDELLGRVHGETASHELLGRLATASSTYLHEVTALPTEVVSHFDAELAKQTKPRQRQRARRQAAT